MLWDCEWTGPSTWNAIGECASSLPCTKQLHGCGGMASHGPEHSPSPAMPSRRRRSPSEQQPVSSRPACEKRFLQMLDNQEQASDLRCTQSCLVSHLAAREVTTVLELSRGPSQLQMQGLGRLAEL